MRVHIRGSFVIASLLAVSIALPAFAQGTAATGNPLEEPNFEWDDPGLVAAKAIFDSYASDDLKGFGADVSHRIGSAPQTTKDRAFAFDQSSASQSAAPSGWSPSVIGEFTIGHADFGSAEMFGGGVRVTKVATPKAGFFGEVLVGATHFSGSDTDMTVIPRVGVLLPLSHKRLLVVADVGVPIIFFPNDREHGFEIAGGIAVPFGG